MNRLRCGFSLVEVVIALGVVSFALLTMMALLPLGLETNRVSAQETRAACILTELEADLRNTHPLANGGKSQNFGLALPYQYDATSGRVMLNTSLSTNTVSAANSIGLNENEETSSITAVPPPSYQATVVYTRVPGAQAHSPIEARLVVGWPCRNTLDPLTLTSPANVAGFVESYVSFSAP